jgi:plastocyanin
VILRSFVYASALAAGLTVILAAASSSAAGKLQVKVENVAFALPKVTAHVGDTIEWVNNDIVAHTATAKDGQFDVMLPVGKSGSTVLKKAGKITYSCKFHPNMTGEIDVEPAK